MYRSRKRIISIAGNVLLSVIILYSVTAIFKPILSGNPYTKFFSFLTSAIVTSIIINLVHKCSSFLKFKAKENSLYTRETGIISEFISSMRSCYSLDDLFEQIARVLEEKADCAVLLIDKTKNYVLYNSPNRITTSSSVMNNLELRFSADWKEGYSFIGDEFGVVSSSRTARGFLICHDKIHMYVMCRYTKLIDTEIFPVFHEEFIRFLLRSRTITDLSEIASLSREWKQLADTQRSFLPPVMPKIDKLQVAAYFRPLVNVSGDYYTVLPISPTKTLLMLGDVSGKGLAAALVMGLVMNTVKILENKEDLPAMIRAIHKAIKGMKLQDKYTVIFIGIVDTERMVINYVNASMSDPLIITNSPSGYRIRPLTSNCSLVGIIDIDEVVVAEQKLFRDDVILMASDGVSEVMNEEGVELGDTELYDETIKSSAAKTPQEFIDDVVNLIMEYNGGKKLRDDVTMMVAKVGR